VIPPLEEVLSAYLHHQQRKGLRPASVHGVAAALDAARDLAIDERDEPAAMLFAFATYRRAFHGGWRFMAAALAISQAHEAGYFIETTPADIDALLSAVMYGTADYNDVRAWVDAHLRPLHQS
jgi:hypothetical protein